MRYVVMREIGRRPDGEGWAAGAPFAHNRQQSIGPTRERGWGLSDVERGGFVCRPEDTIVARLKYTQPAGHFRSA